MTTTKVQSAWPEPENPCAAAPGGYLHILVAERVHELLLQGTERLRGKQDKALQDLGKEGSQRVKLGSPRCNTEPPPSEGCQSWLPEHWEQGTAPSQQPPEARGQRA